MEPLARYEADVTAFFFLAAGGAFFLVIGIAALVGDGSRWFLIFVGMGVMLLWWATRQCRDAEVYPGTILARYWIRPVAEVPISKVKSIGRSNEDGSWTVRYKGGALELQGNRSANSVVFELMRQRPSIHLRGYRVPQR
jgi:hypothetical protein